MLSDERKAELLTLASDIEAGRVFTDRHLRSAAELPMVFMVLMFMDEEARNALAEKVGKNGMLYEYLDKAAPRSINGLPSFFSMQSLTSEEAEYVSEKHAAIHEAKNAVTI